MSRRPFSPARSLAGLVIHRLAVPPRLAIAIRGVFQRSDDLLTGSNLGEIEGGACPAPRTKIVDLATSRRTNREKQSEDTPNELLGHRILNDVNQTCQVKRTMPGTQ